MLSGSVSQNNLFGRAYGIRLAADIGGERDRFYATFSNRRLFDSEYSFSASAYRTDLNYEDFDETTTGVDLSVGRSLDEANNNRGFVRYSFTDREIDADSDITAASLIFREFFQNATTTSLAGISFRSDKRNDRVLPTAGYEYGLNLEGAGLGGFSQFARFEARGAWYHGIPKWLPLPLRDRSSVVLSGRLGYALPFNDIADFDIGGSLGCLNDESCTLDKIDDDLTLPLTERYFLGGLGTYQLRGFKARTVGPRRAVLYDTTFQFTADKAGRYSPVGRVNDPDTGQSVCLDGATQFPSGVQFLGNAQGDNDGKCNNLDDRQIDDFEDLDETDVIGGNSIHLALRRVPLPDRRVAGPRGHPVLRHGQRLRRGGLPLRRHRVALRHRRRRALVLAVRAARGVRGLPARQARRSRTASPSSSRSAARLSDFQSTARGADAPRRGVNDARIQVPGIRDCCGSAASSPVAALAEDVKIAVVDLDQAINATEQGKKAREELQGKQKQAEGQLKPMYEKGKALAEEIQSKRFVLSEEALRKKQLDLAEIQSDLRAKGAELEGQFKVDYERLVGPLRDKLLGIITDFGKEQGYTLILERNTPGVIYAKEALDITDEVVQRFNKKG